MLRLIPSVILLTGCMPPAIVRGDQALRQHRYAEAVEAYDAAQSGYLTATELDHVGPRLIEAANGAAREELEALDRELAESPRTERLEALYALWQEHRSHAGDNPLSFEISQRIDAEIEQEWDGVHALMEERRLADGVAFARSWAQYAPPDSVYGQAYAQTRAAAAQVFVDRLEQSPHATATLFQRVAAMYGAGSFDDSRDALDAIRHVGLGYRIGGQAGPACEAAPTAGDGDVVVDLVVDRCDVSVTSATFDEEYSYTVVETRTVQVERCEQEQVDSRPVAGSAVVSCGYETGAAGVLEFWVCREVAEQRYEPVYQIVCRDVYEEALVEVEHTATRQVLEKTTVRVLQGTMSAPLPGGGGHSQRFDIRAEHVDRSVSEPDVVDFTEEGPGHTLALARGRLLARADGAFSARYRQARAEALLVEARAAPEGTADAAYAEASILGVHDEQWLARYGLTATAVTDAIERLGTEVPDPVPAATSRSSVDLSWVNPNSLVGSDAMAARGFAVGSARFGLVQRQVAGLPDQADRSGLSGQVVMAYSFMAGVQRNGWGFAYEDRLGWFLDFGALTSDLHEYGPDEVEGWAVGGAGLSYEGTVGWRSGHFGIRGGARIFFDTWGLGDVGANDAGLPLVVQVEVRANERYPLIVEAYGPSLAWGWNTFGGRLSVPMGGAAHLVAEVQRSTPKIRFRETPSDKVQFGRHPSTVMVVGGGGVF